MEKNNISRGKKAGMKIQRQEMPENEPGKRSSNYKEVNLGYTEKQAVEESLRCLQCKIPRCIDGCPVGIDIKSFVESISRKKFDEALAKIREKNALPGICGRVCPQEDQCEKACILGIRNDPVAIGNLERFVADREEKSKNSSSKDTVTTVKEPSSNNRVAVVGSGPASLTCAGELAKLGYDVSVFESLHEPGGVLAYGIPEFRLPKDILKREVEYVRGLGVDIKTNMVIGKILSIDELIDQGFKSVFIGTGAGLPYFLNIPGENLNGVYSSNEYLTRSNLMKAYLFPEWDTPIIKGKIVAVIGGGNVAMDSARTAIRMGAEKVYLVYRRTEKEMPARDEEIKHGREEGLIFKLLTAPVEVIGNEQGWVKKIRCIKMELGEPDESGRRSPVPVEKSDFFIDIDELIIAIGQGSNPLLTSSTPGLDINKKGNIIADPETGKTSKRGVFAGGDIVTGSATVILAMGAGKNAAVAIDEYIKSGKW